jgi:hypothetical protein
VLITDFLSYEERPMGYKYSLYGLRGGNDNSIDKEVYFNKQDVADALKYFHILGVDIDILNAPNFVYYNPDAYVPDEDDELGISWDKDSYSMDCTIREFLAAIQKGAI